MQSKIGDLIPWLFFILGIVLLVTGIFLLVQTNGNQTPEVKEISLEIPVSCTLETLGSILSRKGLVDKEEYLSFIKTFQVKGEIIPGHYNFSTNEDIITILTTIVH